MSIGEAIAALRNWAAERAEARALAEFTCGHCARNAQCGREPSATCVEKHEQIARGDDWRYLPSTARVPLPYQ